MLIHFWTKQHDKTQNKQNDKFIFKNLQYCVNTVTTNSAKMWHCDSLMYLLTEDSFDGVLHFFRIVYVDGPDVRPSDVDLCVRVLRGQLGIKDAHTRSGPIHSKHTNITFYKEKIGTSRSVGLPLKKSVFLLLFAGSNLGFRKAQPLAMASKGAGPS